MKCQTVDSWETGEKKVQITVSSRFALSVVLFSTAGWSPTWRLAGYVARMTVQLGPE